MPKLVRARLTGKGMSLIRAFGAGAAINTDITIPGIRVGDAVSSAIELIAGVPTTDVTDELTITADDTIQLSTTATAGNVVDVIFWSKGGL